MIQKSVILFFLVVYSLTILRPVYPYIEYGLNKDYIAKVLCINKDKPTIECDGKCHLTKQLINANDSNESEDNLPGANYKELETHFSQNLKLTNQLTVISLIEKHIVLDEKMKALWSEKPDTPPPSLT